MAAGWRVAAQQPRPRSDPNSRFHPRCAQREIPYAFACGIGYRICKRGRCGTLTGLATTEQGCARAVDDPHSETLGYRSEAQDRIAGPVDRGDAGRIAADALEQGQLSDCRIAPSIWLRTPSGLIT